VDVAETYNRNKELMLKNMLQLACDEMLVSNLWTNLQG